MSAHWVGEHQLSRICLLYEGEAPVQVVSLKGVACVYTEGVEEI